MSLANGTSYAITVKTQPASPAQVCSVVNGAEVVSSQAVTGTIINCTNPNCPTVVSNSSGGSAAPSTPTAFVLGSTAVRLISDTPAKRVSYFPCGDYRLLLCAATGVSAGIPPEQQPRAME